jgi:lysyl-tRNA synthetase, class II
MEHELGGTEAGWQPNRLEGERLEKAARLRDDGVALYPARVARDGTLTEAVERFIAAEAAGETLTMRVAGRIRRANIKGKVSFMHIEDESGRLQLFLRIDNLGETVYQQIADKLIDVDDFVAASGQLMRTRAGEISLQADTITLLAKSLSPLPVIKREFAEDGSVIEHGAFSDVEQRYRQRYADLAVNPAVREAFRQRTRVIRAVQRFMDDEGFLEVETPVLQPIYGGAAARPFVTHHNQLHQDLYLRISFELYLKRLLVGGFDAVYEIGRDFRNEGVSYKHNPEFTMLEFYKAYSDYEDVMAITERMVYAVAMAVHGQPTITYQGQTIDFTPPWPRITVRDVILERTGIDVLAHRDAGALAQAIEATLGATSRPGESWGRLVVENLLGTYVEPTLVQPTFIMDYPREVSPFAKSVAGDPAFTERFEFYIAGMEMGNAFTELNDPREQEARFLEMARLYGRDVDDSTPLDEDYLRAMRYGMPPTGGFGMGIDRLVMLMTDQRSIRDVLLFPHLRSSE